MTIKAYRSPLHNNWKKVTAAYTVINEETIFVDTSGGPVTITLPPTSVNFARRELSIVDVGGSAATNNITVAAAGANTINGSATFVMTQNYGAAMFRDTGTTNAWVCAPVSNLTATSAEINNRDHGQPALVTIAPAAGAANICLVTITVNDGTGTPVTAPVVLDVLLSDAASGAGLTAITASGAVAAGASGADLSTMVSKKALRVQTTAAGVYILSITDTAKTGFFVAVNVPGLKNFVSAALITGNYG